MDDIFKKIRIIGISDLDRNPSSRQELVSGWRQELISNVKVTVLGAGALGNEIVKNLVLLGVGNIRIVDYDIVNESNLSRSVFFRKKDSIAGRFKTDAIVERAREIDPYGYVKLEGYVMNINDIDYNNIIFKDVDIIMSAVDNLETRLHININAYYNEKPVIDGGMEAGMGYIQVVIPPYTSCLACSLLDRDERILMRRLSCAGLPLDLVTPKTPAIITTTSTIAAIMVHELVKIIHGIDLFKKKGIWDARIGEPLAGKRLFINLSHNVYITTEVPVSSRCPIYRLHYSNNK